MKVRYSARILPILYILSSFLFPFSRSELAAGGYLLEQGRVVGYAVAVPVPAFSHAEGVELVGGYRLGVFVEPLVGQYRGQQGRRVKGPAGHPPQFG